VPTVLRVRGHRFFFFSNEGYEPPHIHVETAEKYAKFWLSPVALARSIGNSAEELRELRELVAEHRNLFLEKWHEHFGS
jgi:hypothetical protein